MKDQEVESWVADIAGHVGFVTSGLDVDATRLEALTGIGPQSWLAEIERNDAFLAKFGDRLPTGSRREHDALRDRLCVSIF